MAQFKDMLVYYRKRDGLSQRELASKIGVSASTIGMYESGKRFPEREIEETLADVFNVSLNALRGIDEESLDFELSEKEREMLETFRSLDADQQRQLVLMLAFLKDQNNKK